MYAVHTPTRRDTSPEFPTRSRFLNRFLAINGIINSAMIIRLRHNSHSRNYTDVIDSRPSFEPFLFTRVTHQVVYYQFYFSLSYAFSAIIIVIHS